LLNGKEIEKKGNKMPAWLLPLAISGVSALSGLLANRKKEAEQKSTTNQTTTTDIDQLSMPEYDEQTKMMRDTLMQQYLGRLNQNEDFFSGYRTEGLNTLNQGSDAANRAIENVLASRGLSGTSAGITSSIQNQLNRVNQQNSFLNEIPLLQDKRFSDLLSGASGFFSQIPKGTRMTGRNTSNSTATSTGTTTQPSNMLGGAFGGLANSLFGLYGEGAFDPKKKGTVGPTGTDISREDELAPNPYYVPNIRIWG